METGWGQPKSVLFEKRDTMKDGANTETQSKNIDYDFTKKKILLADFILLHFLSPPKAHVLTKQ